MVFELQTQNFNVFFEKLELKKKFLHYTFFSVLRVSSRVHFFFLNFFANLTYENESKKFRFDPISCVKFYRTADFSLHDGITIFNF